MNTKYETLRKTVKKRMIDLGLDKRGTYELLLPLLTSEKKNVSKSMLCMALTGYRKGRSQIDLLTKLLDVLSSWDLPNSNNN
jgi:hypothetical protein